MKRIHLRARLEKIQKLPFVRGVIAFQIGGVVTMGLSFFSSIMYARLLGLELFGLLAVISAFSGLIGIVASYGQETAAATFVAEAAGQKNKEKLLLSFTYFLQASLLSMAVLVLLTIFCPALAKWLHYHTEIGAYARLALLNAAFQWPNVLAFLALQLEKRFAQVTIIENIIDALQIICATISLLLGYGLSGILWSTLCITIISTPYLLWIYSKSAQRQHFPPLKELVRAITQKDTRPLAGQGLWIALDRTISNNIYPNAFYILLSSAAPLHTVGILRLAMRMASLPVTFIMPSIARMTSVVIPRIASQDSTNLISACKKVFIGTIGLTLFAMIGAAIIIPPLLPIVYGAEYTQSVGIFLLLLPMNIVVASHVISIPILRVLRRVWAIIASNTLSICLSLPSFFLLKMFVSPLLAVCLSILIFQLCSLTLFFYVYYAITRWHAIYKTQ